MKLRLFFKIAFAFIAAIDAYSQTIENYNFLSCFIPKSELEIISVDGNLSEWNWVDEKYFINHSELRNIDNYAQESNDYSIEFFTSWDYYNNYFYIVGTIIDDTLNCDGNFPDDGIEILINANEVNCNFYQTTYRYLYFNLIRIGISLGKDEKNQIEALYGPNWFVEDTSYFIFKKLIQKSNGINQITFEIKIKILAYTSLYNHSASIEKSLNIGDKIGLNFNFNDVDYNNSQRDTQLRTFSNPDHWHVSGESCTFILDKPPLCKKKGIFETLLRIEQ